MDRSSDLPTRVSSFSPRSSMDSIVRWRTTCTYSTMRIIGKHRHICVLSENAAVRARQNTCHPLCQMIATMMAMWQGLDLYGHCNNCATHQARFLLPWFHPGPTGSWPAYQQHLDPAHAEVCFSNSCPNPQSGWWLELHVLLCPTAQ